MSNVATPNYMTISTRTKLRGLTLMITASLTVMSGATIAPSLPQMSRIFAHVPNAELLTKLILTVPAIFIAFGAPLVGLFIDKFGRTKLLFISLIIYGLAGTSGYFLDNIYHILIGRAVLGLSVAGIMTTATTLIGDYFEGEARNKFMGMQGSFMAMGGVIFITLGGLMADIGWRVPFLLYLTAFAVLPMAIYFLYEPSVYQRNKATTEVIPLKVSNSKVYGIYFLAFVSMMLFYMIPVQIPFLINNISEVSNSMVGLAISISTFMAAVTSFNYQRIKRQVHFIIIYSITYFFLAAGFTVIFLAQSYIIICIGLILTGTGMGLVMPNASLWLMSFTPEKSRGRIMGGLSTSIFLGQFFSPLFIQPINATYSMSNIFGMVAILALVIAVILLGGNYAYKVKYR